MKILVYGEREINGFSINDVSSINLNIWNESNGDIRCTSEGSNKNDRIYELDERQLYFLISDLESFRKKDIPNFMNIYGFIGLNSYFKEVELFGEKHLVIESDRTNLKEIIKEIELFKKTYQLYKNVILPDKKVKVTEKKEFVLLLNEGMKHTHLQYYVNARGQIIGEVVPNNLLGVAYLRVKELFQNETNRIKCENCGLDDFPQTKRNQKYCSVKCRDEYRTRKRQAKTAWLNNKDPYYYEKNSGEVDKWLKEWDS